MHGNAHVKVKLLATTGTIGSLIAAVANCVLIGTPTAPFAGVTAVTTGGVATTGGTTTGGTTTGGTTTGGTTTGGTTTGGTTTGGTTTGGTTTGGTTTGGTTGGTTTGGTTGGTTTGGTTTGGTTTGGTTTGGTTTGGGTTTTGAAGVESNPRMGSRPPLPPPPQAVKAAIKVAASHGLMFLSIFIVIHEVMWSCAPVWRKSTGFQCARPVSAYLCAAACK
jgi:hypothetical protein